MKQNSAFLKELPACLGIVDFGVGVLSVVGSIYCMLSSRTTLQFVSHVSNMGGFFLGGGTLDLLAGWFILRRRLDLIGYLLGSIGWGILLLAGVWGPNGDYSAILTFEVFTSVMLIGHVWVYHTGRDDKGDCSRKG